jgi:hypothetical protein
VILPADGALLRESSRNPLSNGERSVSDARRCDAVSRHADDTSATIAMRIEIQDHPA